MVKDEGKYYTVMSVKRGFMEYESQAHYLFGKILIDKKDVILREYLGREMLRIEKSWLASGERWDYRHRDQGRGQNKQAEGTVLD
mgnify:CR=1 FL=1